MTPEVEAAHLLEETAALLRADAPERYEVLVFLLELTGKDHEKVLREVLRPGQPYPLIQPRKGFPVNAFKTFFGKQSVLNDYHFALWSRV